MNHEKSNVVSGRSSADNRGADLGLSSPCERAEASLPALGLREVTPGPWRYAESRGGKWHVYGADDRPIFVPNVKATDRPKKVCEANDRLIALTPQLLSALRLLLEDSKEFHDEPDAEELRSGYHTSCGWCIARQLIAKAEGR